MSEPPSQAPADSRLPALGPRGEGWFILQLVLMAAIAAVGWLAGGNWSGAPHFATALAGAALMLAGVILGGVGVRDLDRALSPFPRPREGAVLIADGIYRRLRHPIYAGVALLGIGWSLLTASLPALAIAVGLAALLDLKARREEGWLRERYPGYTAYAEQTSRFLPGLY